VRFCNLKDVECVSPVAVATVFSIKLSEVQGYNLSLLELESSCEGLKSSSSEKGVSDPVAHFTAI